MTKLPTNYVPNIKCWICGQTANSGEHRLKATDLRHLFPRVSQSTPIYTKDHRGKPKSIGSLKSDQLKWESKLCHQCNTARTQNYDRAWETLSDYLRKAPIGANTRSIRLDKVFPGSTNSSMLDVHLFFVKFLGCLIIEHQVPIPITFFAKSLLTGNSHPGVHLGFGTFPERKKRKTAYITPLQGCELNNQTQFANCQYMIGHVFVDIIYSISSEYLGVVSDKWHPSHSNKVLRLSKFRNNRQAIQEFKDR